MAVLSANEFITWANRLAGLPWSGVAGDFAMIVTGDFGWAIFDGEQVLAVTSSNCSECVLVGTGIDDEVGESFFLWVGLGQKTMWTKPC